MAVVTVYPRHSKKCQRSKDKSARQYRRCKCPLWLEWNENGSQFRKSAKTRTWEIANKAARKLEEELDLKAMGVEPPKKADHISIQSAVELYLKDMDQRGIKDKSKARRMLFGLRDYVNGKNVILLKDVTARLLTEWRSGWTFRKDSDSPSVHWSVVKTFFKWAFSTDLIPLDPSAKLKSLPAYNEHAKTPDGSIVGTAKSCAIFEIRQGNEKAAGYWMRQLFLAKETVNVDPWRLLHIHWSEEVGLADLSLCRVLLDLEDAAKIKDNTIERLISRLNGMTRLEPFLRDLEDNAKRIKNGDGKTDLLPLIHWKYLMAIEGLARAFPHHFASHLMGKIKPDAEAFQHVTDALQCDPHEVIFLDDNDMNVVAARSVGMQAVRVRGIAEAKRALVTSGVL